MYGTASPRNHALVSSYGAAPIDYHTEDFVARVRDLTGDGVEVVFDPVGGGRQLRRSNRALKRGGRLVWFGMAATKKRGLKVIFSTMFTRMLLAIAPTGKSAPLMGDLGKESGWCVETLAELLGLLKDRCIAPVVAERVPLLDAARAHEIMEAGAYGGKIVLVTE
jgi:NADPH2:quinone reductase